MDENFLAWLFAMIVLIGFSLLRSARRARRQEKAAVPVYRPADLERTRKLFHMAVDKLRKLGMEDLMLRDFRFRTELTEADCGDPQRAQEKLQSMLIEMLPHLHLMPDVRLFVTADPAQLVSGALGQYDHSPKKTIRILVHPSTGSGAATIAAALCHECTHCFMHTYLLNDPDSRQNEGLTDTMACLIGFSEIMVRPDNNRALPYLNKPEFEELRRCLLAARVPLQQQYDRKKSLAAARAQLKKNLAGAHGMIGQARAMIAVGKSPKERRLSKASLARLQSTLLALETGACEETLRRAEGALGGDLDAVRKADDSVLALCGDLYRLMLAFQG